MGIFKNVGKKQTAFIVVGGQNYFEKSSTNAYKMISEEKEYGEGVVKVGKKLYYFLGINKNEAHNRSAGKAAAGAIAGGVLTGGFGAAAGAAIGGRRKDDFVFELTFKDYETDQEFLVQVKQHPKTADIASFRVANPIEIN